MAAPAAPHTSRSAIEDAAGSIVFLIKAMRKHWLLITASLVLGAGIAYVYSASLPRVYQSATMIEINPRAAQPLGEKDNPMLDIGAALFWDSREYYETQYKIITSESVMTAVARNLSLANDWNFMGYKSAPPTPPPLAAAARVLRAHVSVEAVKYSRLALIKVDDTDPKRARRICDAVAAVYIEQNLQNAIDATSNAVVWLNGQVDTLKTELEHDENSLHAFKQQNDLPSTSINEASNMLRLEMQDYNAALTKTRTRRAELAARVAELKKVTADNPDEIPSSELLSSAYLKDIRTLYLESKRERDALLAEGKGENHPTVKRATERVNEARAALLGEIHNIQAAVERDLAVVARQESAESGLFENARRRAVELNMKEIEYHRLDRTRERNEKLYSMLLERMKEADLARMMRVNNVRVVDAATEPGAPIYPRISMNVGLGVFFGLLFGLITAWVREQLDSSLKTPDDLEEKLAVTFLGLLPDLRSNDAKGKSYYGKRRRRLPSSAKQDGALAPELIVHERPLSGIAEAARSIRTNLMFMNPDKPFRKLLVSSAAPSEGKTTVATSIAIAFAQSGERVCIIDCDLRRPRLHRIFGRAGDMGITNVLVGEASIDEVAKPTVVPNLSSIPAGPTPPNPADLLHSDRFKKFLADLGARFDRIVIDSPPLVAVTDSAILSTLVDGAIFVVRAFKTSTHLSRQGLRSLRDVEAPVVGAVLNAVNLNRHEYSYYYHYYYYKREGYGTIASNDRPSQTNDGGDESRDAAPH